MELTGLSCIFPVPDILKTARFYTDSLGFRAVGYVECEEPHICLYRDKTEIILLKANTDRVFTNRELYGYGYDAYLYTSEMEELEKQLRRNRVKIARPLSMTDYKNREFVIEDIDGRWIAFGRKED
ncbi:MULTISPECIES: VOC family protein [Treponema]|uniref:VOC family protein n=1 Tax=Treponema TaxID=157 RepID=UPI0023F50150|nr:MULTISPECIES: VOC family protein [Treponema]MDD7126746.1 hypothetical protein [Treponema porcinum]MDY4468591.1 hypothetical protein [Treponema porcinum]MDY5046714.1 hypothetical protein [Treponema porcinum]MDY5454664.1 hypothetical protein [Treponema porcinum]